MTEAEWLACADPNRMLNFWYNDWRRRNAEQSVTAIFRDAPLAEDAQQPLNKRLRLFACACCRRVWRLLREAGSRAVVETAERFAEGAATAEQLATALAAAPRPPSGNLPAWRAWGPAMGAAWGAADLNPLHAARLASRLAAQAAAEQAARATEGKANWAEAHRPRLHKLSYGLSARRPTPDPMPERRAQADLLRDIFANPFRTVFVDPGWRRWQDDLVGRMLTDINERRAFAELPILADALEDAGCADRTILDHCRGPGPHVSGCWVVDLLLGKS
jgi:hypothetical protein